MEVDNYGRVIQDGAVLGRDAQLTPHLSARLSVGNANFVHIPQRNTVVRFFCFVYLMQLSVMSNNF